MAPLTRSQKNKQVYLVSQLPVAKKIKITDDHEYPIAPLVPEALPVQQQWAAVSSSEQQ